MIQNLYKQYLISKLSEYSPLELKLRLVSKEQLDYYNIFKNYNKYKNVEIFADFMYETGRSVEEYILDKEIIEHVQNAKTNINLKRTTNPKKIIQYTLVYYCITNENLSGNDLQDCIDKYLTIEERLNLLYTILKFYSNNNKDVSYYAIEMLSTYNITNDREHIELLSTEIANDILNNLIVSLSNNADSIMKTKLENLLNTAGITDYEIKPYYITEHIPNSSSRWYGGDYGNSFTHFDGTIKETIHDFGYIAIVKKPSAQIYTDGKNFYITFRNISKPIVYSDYQIKHDVNTGRDAINNIVVDSDILIKLLMLNKDISKTIITATVRIRRFNKKNKYNFAKSSIFNQTINNSNFNPLCINIIVESDIDGIITFKFNFMSNVNLNNVKNDLDEFIEDFLYDNGESLQYYSENRYIDEFWFKPKYFID